MLCNFVSMRRIELQIIESATPGQEPCVIEGERARGRACHTKSLLFRGRTHRVLNFRFDPNTISWLIALRGAHVCWAAFRRDGTCTVVELLYRALCSTDCQ